MAGSMSPADPGGSTGAVATPRWLAWMLGGRRAETVGFLWGVAEASLFFVVPDVWTGWIAIVAPRRAVPVLVMTLLGAVLGALLLFLVAPYATDALVAWFGMVPGLLPGDLATAREQLATQGVGAFTASPLGGIPLKLYAFGAGLDAFGAVPLVVGVVLNRLVRVGGFTLLMGIAGALGRPLVRRRPAVVAAVYVVGWCVFYGTFWMVRSPG